MVTDTAMVIKNGKVYAFGPVVRELSVFLELFERIEWIGFCYPERVDNPIMVPVPENVKCILLKHTGGDYFIHKLGVLLHTPLMLWHIMKGLRGTYAIHTRGPSSPALLAVIISRIFKNRIWWNKYAGNWVQKNPPFFYGLQRSLLERASWTKVTINGRWPGQKPHCLSFENPCVTDDELFKYQQIAIEKEFEQPLILLFVGRMELGKGPGRLIEAIKSLGHVKDIEEIVFAGEGKDLPAVKKIAEDCSVPCRFVGTLGRDELDGYYKKAHLLVLPSTASEGFPKVIAEAAAAGCVPLVSDISSIGQYIRHLENGYLMKDLSAEAISADVLELIVDRKRLKLISLEAMKIANVFTYSLYRTRIREEILKQ